MNPRNLFLLITAISSAALGASVAVILRLHPTDSLQAEQTIQPAQIAAVPLASPSASLVPPPVSSPASTVPIAASTVAASTTAEEFNQIKVQLQRAIHERNSVLLRSLLQIKSLREALGTVAAEPVNFDNLDASTWKVLEKAIDYRCRQQDTSHPAEICLMRPAPQPAQ